MEDPDRKRDEIANGDRDAPPGWPGRVGGAPTPLPTVKVPRPLLVRSLRPFVNAARAAADPADAGLRDDQARTITVTLGDCRTLETLFLMIGGDDGGAP